MAYELVEDFNSAPLSRAPDTAPSGWTWSAFGANYSVSGGLMTATAAAEALVDAYATSTTLADVKKVTIGIRVDPTLYTSFVDMGRMLIDIGGSTTPDVERLVFAYLRLDFYRAPTGTDTDVQFSADAYNTGGTGTESQFLSTYLTGEYVNSPAATIDVVMDFTGTNPTLSIDGDVIATLSSFDMTGLGGLASDAIELRCSDGVFIDYLRFGEAAAPPPDPGPVSNLFWTDHTGTIETIKTEAP